MRVRAICVMGLFLLLPRALNGQETLPTTGSLSAASFLPEGYVTDGSVSYQPQLQAAIDAAAGKTLVFPPMTYLLENEAGLAVRSGTTLFMHGAVFLFDAENTADGQAFLGENVTDVTFLGGQIVGRRDAWPDSVNIAGIRITGDSARIRIRDLLVRDLSSNGIGVFGPGDESPIQDVLVEAAIVRNCSNVYVDYLQPGAGPAKGSRREDQGGIAFYHVERFLVHGSAFEGSRSDGTHFYQCGDGQFTDNRVTGSQMGGYFLEGCRNVLAAGNLICENGSRGVTIERDSTNCTLVHNVIAESGREGLWAPDVAGCLVADNIFRHNGRKDDGDRDSEIKVEETDKFETVTADFRIADNLFYTTESQSSAVWITAGVEGTVVENNSLRGPAPTIRVDSRAVVRNNDLPTRENAAATQTPGEPAR